VEVQLAEAELDRGPRRRAAVVGAAVQAVGALERADRRLLLAQPAASGRKPLARRTSMRYPVEGYTVDVHRAAALRAASLGALAAHRRKRWRQSDGA